MSDPGFQILLAVQLGLCVWAMIAWGIFWQTETTAALKRAAAATAFCFGMIAVTIAYLFDVELMA